MCYFYCTSRQMDWFLMYDKNFSWPGQGKYYHGLSALRYAVYRMTPQDKKLQALYGVRTTRPQCILDSSTRLLIRNSVDVFQLTNNFFSFTENFFQSLFSIESASFLRLDFLWIEIIFTLLRSYNFDGKSIEFLWNQANNWLASENRLKNLINIGIQRN